MKKYFYAVATLVMVSLCVPCLQAQEKAKQNAKPAKQSAQSAKQSAKSVKSAKQSAQSAKSAKRSAKSVKSAKPSAKPAKMVAPASSTKVDQLYDHLSDEVAASHASYQNRLRYKTYYANDTVKEACEAVPACAEWALEHAADASFKINSVTGKYHTGIKKEDKLLGIEFDEIQIRKMELDFSYVLQGEEKIRFFRLSKVPLSSKACVGCKAYAQELF